MWQSIVDFFYGPPTNLPIELRREIRTFADHNCGSFLQSIQPFRPESFDDHPEAREFFRKTVLYSLKKFCESVTTLHLYKRSWSWMPDVNNDDEAPLVCRIQNTIRDVESKPNMSGKELADKCKKISQWKTELRQLHQDFHDLLDIFPLQDYFGYMAILSSLKVFKLRALNLRPLDLHEYMREMYYNYTHFQVMDPDFLHYIQEIETEMLHDDASLDIVLQSI